MKLINRKTRKAIKKSLAKAVRKHGSKIATGLVAGLASSVATYASTEEGGSGGKRKKGKKGKFAKLLPKAGVGKSLALVPGLKQVREMLPGKGPARKRATKQPGSASAKKGRKRAKKQTAS